MTKILKFNEEARQGLEAGVNALAVSVVNEGDSAWRFMPEFGGSVGLGYRF